MRHARTALTGACLLSTAAVLVGAVVVGGPATAAPAEWCTDPSYDRGVDVYTASAAVDPGVSMYVGGRLNVSTATELEGLLVVGGDADLAAPSSLNVGSAGGGGSAITPAAGEPMLVVGGDLAAGRGLQVGFHAGGGAVVVGGAITGDVSTAPYAGGTPGPVAQGVGRATALAPYADLPATYAGLAASAEEGARKVALDGSTLTLETPGRYVVDDVDGLERLELPGGSDPVILVVRGSDVSIPDLRHVTAGGTRVYQSTQYLGRSLLWVFPDATSVAIGTNDQFPGSLLLPREDSVLTVSTSTNGRVIGLGDVRYTGGAGIEHHAYPWTGECTDLPEPEPAPSDEPTHEPTATPLPTDEPTPAPSEDVVEPTEGPTAEPTDGPTSGPVPSDAPATVAPVPGDGGSTDTPGTTTDDAGTGDGRSTVAGGDELPRTGASVGILLAVVGALLAAGAAVLVGRRRLTTR